MIGNKLWAKAYVVISNGKKIYVENSVSYIKFKIESDDEVISLDIATWIRDQTINVNAKDILYYGSVL